MSINVILDLHAKPQSLDELKSTLKAILPDTRSYDGCMGVKVIGNQDDVLNIILSETWESREKYSVYLAWRGETGALDALGALLSTDPSIRYYDDLDI